MPINTMKCPSCGARVNHVLRAGDFSSESKGQQATQILCPRCKKTFSVSEEEVSQRAKDDMRELQDFNQLMGDSEEDFKGLIEKDGIDSVEKALERADEVFAAARGALDDISLEQTSDSIDADQLLRQYAVPEVKDFALNQAERLAQRMQDRYGLSDRARDGAQTLAGQAIDWAEGKINEKLG